ncbi:MAG: hypothetical protein N2044_11855 [Cyclobacteriaceae bacterium]|nr:hypothetical protein [Cyclobacteriaceae bacterium]
MIPVARYFTLTLCAFISSSFYQQTFAQLDQRKRLEIQLGVRESEFRVIPVESFGVLLYRSKSERRQDFLELQRLDTAFRLQWKNIIPVERKFQPILSKHVGYDQYMLFFHSEYKEINFRLYKINLDSGSYQVDTIFNIIPFLPTHFEVNRVGALIGGYLINRIPVVVFYDFTTRKTRILPGLFNEQGELLQIQVNPDQSFHVLISTQPRARFKTIWVKYYDASGNIRNNTLLRTEQNVSLLSGRSIKSNRDDVVVAGTYGMRTAEYSSGLFIARISKEGDQEIRLYPFYELQNFFKYLKPRQEKRVRQRIEQKLSKGKRTKLQYRILVHQLIPFDNQFILLGEAFYPVYKRDDRFNYGLAVSAYVPYIFDGYRYTHAVVIGFDQQGNLLWDNSFEINDVKTFNLEQFVKLDYRNNRVALLYLFDNRIRYKLIQNNQVIEGKKINPLELSFQAEEPEVDEDIKRLEYWYPGNFLAYGIQRPYSRAVSRSRERFFFINKVAYR